ncbi:hypothetical protein V3O24_04515 [Methylobacter sp. Wu8]|uniref:hypothetical protein n=1 Tax=Methylobacter sp. Wu8 TaxID=3118457 RepID=UPI002F32BCF1
MPTSLNTSAKKVMNIRHSLEVKTFLDEKAKELNLAPATLYRNVLNAGLEAMYDVKIHNNKFVQPPRC